MNGVREATHEELKEFYRERVLENIELKERVQELEEDYKVRQVEYLEEHIDRLEQQNKRYREVINNINEKAMLYGVDEQVYEAIKEAIKALEGDLE